MSEIPPIGHPNSETPPSAQPAKGQSPTTIATHTVAINILGECYSIPSAPTAPIPESKSVKTITKNLAKLAEKIEKTGPIKTMSEEIEAKAKEFESRRHEHFDQFGNIIIKPIANEKSSSESTKSSKKQSSSTQKQNIKGQQDPGAKSSHKRERTDRQESSEHKSSLPTYSKKKEVEAEIKQDQQEAAEKTQKRRRFMMELEKEKNKYNPLPTNQDIKHE